MKRLSLSLAIILGALFTMAAAPIGGQLSKNISWELADSTLYISGHGVMPSYGTTASARIPWTEERIARRIARVVIGEGITEVGNYNFGFRSEVKRARLEEDMAYYPTQGVTSTPLYLNLREIILPSTLVKIGHHAFARTPIRAIKLPEGLKEIGSGAFANTALLSVIMPTTLRSIGSEAFSGCPNLQAVDFNDNPLKLSAGLFFDCNRLRMLLHTTNIKGVKPSTFSATALMDLPDYEILEMFHTDGLKAYLAASLPDRKGYGGTDEQFEQLTAKAVDEFYVREAKNATSLFGLDNFRLSGYDAASGTITVSSVNHGSFLLPLSEVDADRLKADWDNIINSARPTFFPANGRVALQSVTFPIGDRKVIASLIP